MKKLFITSDGFVLYFSQDNQEWSDLVCDLTFDDKNNHPIDSTGAKLDGEFTDKDYYISRAKYMAASQASSLGEQLKPADLELDDEDENINTLANLYASDACEESVLDFNVAHDAIFSHLELLYPELV